MSFPRRALSTASLAALLICSACSGQMTSHDVMVPFAQLPVAAQKAFVAELPDETPASVELKHSNGIAVYEAKAVHSNGSVRLVKIDEFGKLVCTDGAEAAHSTEKHTSWKNLPKAVRKTITANAHGAVIKKVVKEKENGVTVYEAKFTSKDGVKHVLTVSKGGKLLSQKP